MRYLGLTARQLRRDRTVDFAWWQINARITGPLVGLMYGAVWGALLYALFGPAIGVVTGLFTAAMSFAAHQFVRADLKQVSVPKEGVHGPGHLARHYARVGAASALLAGAVTGAASGCASRRTASSPVFGHASPGLPPTAQVLPPTRCP